MKILIPVFILAAALFQCKSAENTSSTAKLENTYWKLAEMNGMPVDVPENSREVHIVLSDEKEEKRLKGFGGCNGLGGSYSLDGTKIKFQVISTKMACDRLNVENYLTKALNDADTYQIKGETLELFQGETFLIRFNSVYLQ